MTIDTVVSVRGDARRTVEPDSAVLDAVLAAAPAPRTRALDALGRAQRDLVASLEQLGAVALTVDTRRAGLTWSMGGVSVHDEFRYDESSGEHRPTGDVNASVRVTVTAREFAVLPTLSQTLATVEHLELSDVRWRVDEDNAAWPSVRADAVHAALARADDYAAALNGTVVSIDQVADLGLLEQGAHHQSRGGGAVLASASLESGQEGDVPTLEPVPQEIRAAVDARVTARTDPPSLRR